MANVVSVGIKYQNCEEIMVTRGLYQAQGNGFNTIESGQIAVQELVTTIGGSLSDLSVEMPVGSTLLAVEGFSPGDENEGWGPWGFSWPLNLAGTEAVARMSDMIAAQIVWSGTNELDEPVRNAKFFSAIQAPSVDCMEISSDLRGGLKTAFETAFPDQIVTSLVTFDAVVRNTRAGVPGLVTYHPRQSLEVSAILASMRTRRGDVTPRKGKIVVVP